MNKSTPPREVLNELPDYYLGHLIFYDNGDDDAMRWVVYDGRTKVRCISKAAAEKYISEKVADISETEIYETMIAHHHLKRAWKALNKAANDSKVEDKLWLELKSVEVRRIAAQIDTFISQRISPKQQL